MILKAHTLSAPAQGCDDHVCHTLISSYLSATITNHISKQVTWYVTSADDVLLAS